MYILQVEDVGVAEEDDRTVINFPFNISKILCMIKIQNGQNNKKVLSNTTF